MRLVLISTGAYSDYSVGALFNWETTRQPDELLEEYEAINPDQTKEYKANFSAFVAWLSAQPGITKLTYEELYLGGFRAFERPLRFENK